MLNMFCSSHDLMKWHLHNSGPPGFYSASQKHFEHFGKFNQNYVYIEFRKK